MRGCGGCSRFGGRGDTGGLGKECGGDDGEKRGGSVGGGGQWAAGNCHAAGDRRARGRLEVYAAILSAPQHAAGRLGHRRRAWRWGGLPGTTAGPHLSRAARTPPPRYIFVPLCTLLPPARCLRLAPAAMPPIRGLAQAPKAPPHPGPLTAGAPAQQTAATTATTGTAICTVTGIPPVYPSLPPRQPAAPSRPRPLGPWRPKKMSPRTRDACRRGQREEGGSEVRGGRGRPLAPGRASPIEDKRTGREERDGLSTRPHARPEAELPALASRDRPRQVAGWQQ